MRVHSLSLTAFGPFADTVEVDFDEAGRDGLRRELERLWTERNEAGDGTTRVRSEYLEVIAVVR